MAVRSSHARASKNHVFFKPEGFALSVMFTCDTFMPKSRIYSVISRVKRGTLTLLPETRFVHLKEDGSIIQTQPVIAHKAKNITALNQIRGAIKLANGR